jgi:rod shape-determining protein MreD
MTLSSRRGPLPSLAPAAPEEILLPVRPWFVVLTLVVAFVLNAVPLSGAARDLRPDLAALVILYWCTHEPRIMGVALAWLLGLVADVADGTLFGQHALAYAVLAFGAGFLRRRLLRFPLWQQALHVALLMAVCLALVLAVRRVGGAGPTGSLYFASAVTAALLWPPLSVVLQWPQRPPPSPGEL